MKVVWTETALKKFSQIIDYLKENFSEKAAKDFAAKTDEKIAQIQQFPEIGRKSPKAKDVRKVNIGKRTSMFYKVKTTILTILTFSDHREDPDKSQY
ncbi:MAG: type II toxin-antitoxin system RelE/ParE family toxin [Cytophagales bacterium]|nr:MAG: type II toxin-antitoxin system RelE/ParE family toxin [Cytophagales bacterium]